MSAHQTAVVMMNLGGPDSVDDVEPYLYNIFADRDLIQLPLGFFWQKFLARRISKAKAPESRKIYEAIGGSSPILQFTEDQAKAVGEHLGPGFKTYAAMRNWSPYIPTVVDRLVEEGATEVVGVPLYPQRSRATSGSAMRELRRAMRKRAPSIPVYELCCFPDEPGFVDSFASPIQAVYDGLSAERQAKVHVLFTAHGLPQKVIDRGDPYLAHVQATVRAVMARLPKGVAHGISFQSRATKAKWLEPATEDALDALAKDGVKDVIVVPVAFVTEHVETLFELDMLLREPALEAGIEGYHRIAAPGTHPAMMEGLAKRIKEARESEEPLCSAPNGVRCPRIR